MARRTSDFPRDIIESFLLKLSVKSVLRFRSVSKSWNSVVSDPIFVRNHYQLHPTHNLFLRKTGSTYTCDNGLSLVKLKKRKLQTVKTLQFPVTVPWSGDRLCFSEYGVILLANYRFNRYLLWNPCTTQTTAEISTRELSVPYGTPHCSGLCYDPVIDDFKVVFLYPDFYAFYSCKNKSWSNRKQFPRTIAAFEPTDSTTGVSVDGAIYWLLDNSTNSCAQIVYYDPRDDNLKILQKLRDEFGELMHSFLLDLGGHLCLYYYRAYSCTIHIWTKEKGIDNNYWKELTKIDPVFQGKLPNANALYKLEPLCFVGNKIVSQYRDDDKLLVYNALDDTFEELKEKLVGIGSLIPFQETLHVLT